jgi:hypothetical protein
VRQRQEAKQPQREPEFRMPHVFLGPRPYAHAVCAFRMRMRMPYAPSLKSPHPCEYSAAGNASPP